jgi:hypothetical protein
MTKLPRLELTEDSNNNNEFIIFRYQIKGKKTAKGSVTSSKKHNLYVKKTRRHRKNTTRKHKKSKGLFNIF